MSRLQVGGLALVINSCSGANVGKVVELLSHHEAVRFEDGDVWENCWQVTGEGITGTDGQVKPWVISKAVWLMPLGDDKGIELYGLREEIMTGHDKEAV